MTPERHTKTCHCGEILSFGNIGTRRIMECPSCGKKYDIRPRRETPEVESDEAEILSIDVLDTETRCPYCAEKIISGATKCPHCREYLKEENRPTVGRVTSAPQEEGVVAFILALLGFFLCGFFFPVAWYVAVEKEAGIRRRRLDVPDLLVAAKWIGKIGTILMVLAFLFAGLLLGAPMVMR